MTITSHGIYCEFWSLATLVCNIKHHWDWFLWLLHGVVFCYLQCVKYHNIICMENRLFFKTSPVPAVLSIIPSRARLPAELPTVPWCARAWPVGWVALAVNTLAVPFTSWAPQSFPALAASRELVAWWVVAVTLDPAVPPGPTGIAQTPARHCITDGVDATIAIVVALWTPDSRVTCAFSRLLVTFALLA